MTIGIFLPSIYSLITIGRPRRQGMRQVLPKMIIAHPTFDKDDQSIENKDQSIEIEDQSIEKNESQTHITHHNKLEMEREYKEIFIGFRNDHSGIENSEGGINSKSKEDEET